MGTHAAFSFRDYLGKENLRLEQGVQDHLAYRNRPDGPKFIYIELLCLSTFDPISISKMMGLKEVVQESGVRASPP